MHTIKIFLLFVGISFCNQSFSQSNELSILNGRYYLTFPDSAKNIARGTDIMAADPNGNNETRIVYDKGDQRMVFFAQELFLKNVDRLEKKLRSESTVEFPVLVKSIYDKDSVQGIMVTPVKTEENEKAVFINSLVVKNADNSISRLSVYLNPKAFANKMEFEKIAEQVFNSFRKGERSLNFTAHSETFKLLESENKIEFKLPKDYVISVDRSHDFEVYKLQKLIPYGDPSQVDLTIYAGFHPSYFNTEFQLQKFQVAETESGFGKTNVKWLNFRDDTRKIFLREQIVPAEQIQKGAVFHVAMISNDALLLEELTSIVKDISITTQK